MITFSIIWPDTSLRSGWCDERLSCWEENPADRGALVDDSAVVRVKHREIFEGSDVHECGASRVPRRRRALASSRSLIGLSLEAHKRVASLVAVRVSLREDQTITSRSLSGASPHVSPCPGNLLAVPIEQRRDGTATRICTASKLLGANDEHKRIAVHVRISNHGELQSTLQGQSQLKIRVDHDGCSTEIPPAQRQRVI